MSVVNGKDVILSIAKGAAYYPVACNAVCSLKFVRETIETTFRDSSDIRQFKPGKAVITLEGSGPIEYDAGFSPSDVFDAAYSGTIIDWEFTLTDSKGHATIQKIYSGKGFFTTCDLTGDVQQAAMCDYTIQVNGDIAGTSDPGNEAPRLRTLFYDAIGGESSLFNALWINCDMIKVERNGIGLEMIYAGTPNGNQALIDTVGGTIAFDPSLPLAPLEYVQTIFEK